MGNFNRGSRSGGGRGFERRSFNDRDSRGPVQMHQTVCDNCKKECEVPFRPTSGKPVFCNNCFEGNRGSDFKRSNFDDRQMFEAICDECKKSCKVPFRPSGDKPVYCSDCFGGKKNSRSSEQTISQSQYTAQFELLNNKLDKILTMLAPNAFVQAEVAEAGENGQPKQQTVINQDVTESPKKKPAKKKSV